MYRNIRVNLLYFTQAYFDLFFRKCVYILMRKHNFFRQKYISFVKKMYKKIFFKLRQPKENLINNKIFVFKKNIISLKRETLFCIFYLFKAIVFMEKYKINHFTKFNIYFPSVQLNIYLYKIFCLITKKQYFLNKIQILK